MNGCGVDSVLQFIDQFSVPWDPPYLLFRSSGLFKSRLCPAGRRRLPSPFGCMETFEEPCSIFTSDSATSRQETELRRQ
jgi:hypothetical protein